MDSSAFTHKMHHASVMQKLGERPDYWRGYIRGLRRKFYGEIFGSDLEHNLWLSLADCDDQRERDAGLGYRDAFQAE